MPIYDQGYTRWNGEFQNHPVRWWPILRHGVTEVLGKKKYLILLLLSWGGPFARGVQLFLQAKSKGLTARLGADLNLPALQGLFSDGMEFYFSVFQQQGFAILMFVLLVGSDLIARDRRFNALQIYFSKPLTANDYILGKLGTIAAFALFVTWLPIILLWLFALTLQLRADYLQSVWQLPFMATAYSLLLVAVMGMLVLALSSMGRRAIFIAVSFIVLFGYGPFQGVVMILQSLSGNEYWGLIRIAGNLNQVGAWWFGTALPDDYHPILSLAVLVALVVGCYAILRRRIRPVEVVL